MEQGPAAGFFLSLEGPDGSGKTTLARLVGRWLEERGYATVVTFEPGATDFGRIARRLLLEEKVAMTPLTEALLLAADRAQHVEEIIRPALAAGRIVISDRYVDSSLVYQGYAGGAPVDAVRRINEEATGKLYPDLTVVLDVDPAVALARRGGGRDRFEGRGLAFQQKLYEGFRRLAAEEPDRIIVVPNAGPPAHVCQHIGELVLERLRGRQPAPAPGRAR